MEHVRNANNKLKQKRGEKGDMNTRTQKKYAFLLCLVFITSTSLASFFLVKEATHDCLGENCSVCVCIHQVQQTWKMMGAVKAEAVNISFVALLFAVLTSGQIFLIGASLVKQKVRLND